jgi:IclR family acetate operon transcriptional repressor
VRCSGAVRRDRHAQDNEEFLPGLFCVAVPVPHANGRSSLSVAVQAPVIRLGPDKVAQVLPALRRAAEALGRIVAGATSPTHAANE